MAEPQVTLTRLAGTAEHGELLVVGPSLGTSVQALWAPAAELLGEECEVLGWDLPGHGRSPAATAPFTVGELASAVRRAAAAVVGDSDRHASYAGVSLAGAVALELALDPGVFSRVACVASAAQVGDPASWHERAALVRRVGTPVMVSGSAQRWFAPGFIEKDPDTADRLLLALSDTDRESYALACEALADFDVYPRLGEVSVPLLVAPGEQDVVVPPEVAEQTAAAARGAKLVVLAGCGHLPPAEDPEAMASLLRAHAREDTDD
jgi:3-oxoadipate enol-lactonase